MAQVVGYFDDNVEYEEGPFVLCNPLVNGWRIEVEQKGHRCPVLPDISIYKIMREGFGLEGKTFDKKEIERICDSLNQMVKEGKITLNDNVWEAHSYV